MVCLIKSIMSHKRGNTKHKFGWFTWTPYILQGYAIGPTNNGVGGFFLCIISSCAFIQGFVVSGLINVCLSSIEKQFQLSSSLSGAIVSAYDIAFLIFVIPVSMWGSNLKIDPSLHRSDSIPLSIINSSNVSTPRNSIKTTSQNFQDKGLTFSLQINYAKKWMSKLVEAFSCEGPENGSNRIKLMTMGMFFIGLGSLIFALPQFLTFPYAYSFSVETNVYGRKHFLKSSNEMRNVAPSILHSIGLQGENTSRLFDINDNRTNEQYLCNPMAKNNIDNETKSPPIYKQQFEPKDDIFRRRLYFFSLFFLGNSVIGIGACPLYTLAVTFIDENSTFERVSLYIGIFYTISMLGPAVGYILGGYILGVYVDYWKAPYTLNIDPSDPRWVGAWWLGFLVCTAMSWLICIPLSGFPPAFPGMRERFLQREKQSFQTMKDHTTAANKTRQISPQNKRKYKLPAITAENFNLDESAINNLQQQNRYADTDRKESANALLNDSTIKRLKGYFMRPSSPQTQLSYIDDDENNENILPSMQKFANNPSNSNTPSPHDEDYALGNIPVLQKILKTGSLYQSRGSTPFQRPFVNDNNSKRLTTISASVDENQSGSSPTALTAFPSPHNTRKLPLKESFVTNMLSIIKNPVFMYLTLGGALDGLLLNGFAAFLPKYLEMQFDISSKQASLYVGIVTVPAGMFGMFLGGYLIKRFNVNVKGMLRIVFIASLCNFICMFALLIYCPETQLYGINAFLGTSPRNLDRYTPGFPYKEVCNSKCSCDHRYEPVCWADPGLTFYSACHAGCTQASPSVKELSAHLGLSKEMYENCSCLPKLNAKSQITGAPNIRHSISHLKTGKCPYRCNNFLLFKSPPSSHEEYILNGYTNAQDQPNPVLNVTIAFLTLIFVALFLLLMVAVISVNITLKSVESTENSLAMGIQWVLVRLLGTIPGPIMFGKILDLNCLLWEIKTYPSSDVLKPNTDQVEYGACQLYNNRSSALSLLILTVVCKSIGQIFYGLSFYSYAKHYKNYEENMKRDQQNSPEQQNTLNICNAISRPNEELETMPKNIQNSDFLDET